MVPPHPPLGGGGGGRRRRPAAGIVAASCRSKGRDAYEAEETLEALAEFGD